MGAPPRTTAEAAEEEKRRIMEERRRKKDEEWKRDMMGVQTPSSRRGPRSSRPRSFPHDTAVYVQRSNGSESIGFVHNSTPRVAYTRLSRPARPKLKRCSEDMLRKAAANAGPAASTTAA